MNARTTAGTTKTAATRILQAALLSAALIFAGCGGGGSAPSTVNGVAANTPAAQPAANSFAVTGDGYGLQSPTYLASSVSSQGIVLRAAIASGMTDPNFKTVTRIDVNPGAAIAAGTVYSLAGAASGPAFPGAIYFLNGHSSTLLRTVDGTIRFTSFGVNQDDRISGSFSAVVEDGNDSSTPKARYTVSATFDFGTGNSNATAAAGPDLAAAATAYDANCASCHALGSHDATSNGASDLTLKGAKMSTVFPSDQATHQGTRLAAGDRYALQVLLNAN